MNSQKELAVSRDDFPFYDGIPVRLGAVRWALVIFATALGFAILAAPVAWYASSVGQFVPAILFFALPLAALAWATPQHWTAIFRKVGPRDLGWMVLFAVLNLVVTVVIGFLVVKAHGAQANPAFALMADQDAVSRVLFFLKTLPQLFGEELVSILPMLALMTFFRTRVGMSRTSSIVVAWILSAVLFGALHLPTYRWDFVQCFVVIGSARLILSLAYLKTKNIWVSTGAHVLNDWTMFGIGLLDTASSG